MGILKDKNGADYWIPEAGSVIKIGPKPDPLRSLKEARDHINKLLDESIARQMYPLFITEALGPVRTSRFTSQSSNVKEVEKPMNPSYSKFFEPSYVQTKTAGSLQASAPIALAIEDKRKPTSLPSQLLDIIPSGTVFQGRIGSVTGTFKKNQNTVCQLDGYSVWVTPTTYNNFGGFNGPCHNYQPVHGRVIIERNA